MKRRSRKKWTRRDFLRSAASAALVGSSGVLVWCRPGESEGPSDKPAGTPPPERPRPPDLKGKVVLIRDREVLDDRHQPRAEILSRMLDEGVRTLLDESETDAAWARLVHPDDTVGVKSNEWRFLPTPRSLEQAIRERVVRVGVPAERIGIDDRGVLRDPLFQETTALINVRPLRTHHWSGVGSCIKNYIMFSPDPPSWHDDACANLAGLWDLPLVKGKTRLNVLVMLTPLFHGKGPHHFQPRYTWDYRGLILGTDPVAVDATGLRILEAKRKEHFGQDQPLVVSPKHIRVAEQKFRLGVAEPSRIQIIRRGWMEEALV